VDEVMERKGVPFICELKVRGCEEKKNGDKGFFKNLLLDHRELSMIYRM